MIFLQKKTLALILLGALLLGMFVAKQRGVSRQNYSSYQTLEKLRSIRNPGGSRGATYTQEEDSLVSHAPLRTAPGTVVSSKK